MCNKRNAMPLHRSPDFRNNFDSVHLKSILISWNCHVSKRRGISHNNNNNNNENKYFLEPYLLLETLIKIFWLWDGSITSTNYQAFKFCGPLTAG